MKLLARLLFAVALGLLALWYLPLLQGYVLIRTGGVAMEMNVMVLILLVLLAVALLHGLVWLWNMPGNAVRRYLDRRAQAQLELGMLALSEGDWTRAEKALRLSARKSNDPTAHYLAAAQAAQSAGRGEGRIEAYLDKAEEVTRKRQPVAVTRAQLMLAAGNPAGALEVLEGLSGGDRHGPRVVELLARCYERLGRWQELSKLVPDMVRHKLIEARQGDQIQHRALRERLAAVADTGELQSLWQSLPRAQRKDPEVLAGYAENAVKLGQADGVEKELRQALDRDWSPRLVSVYGRLAGVDPGQRLRNAERWLSKHPDDALLHLTLGRLCIACQLWGKAREHLETAIALDPLPEAHQELGDLLEREGETEAALVCYRQALGRLQGNELPGRALSRD